MASTDTLSSPKAPHSPASPPAIEILPYPQPNSQNDKSNPVASPHPSLEIEDRDPASAASSHSSGSRSFRSDSILEVLDDDDEPDEEDMILDDEEAELDEPLVRNRAGRRRTRWNGDEEKQEKTLLESTWHGKSLLSRAPLNVRYLKVPSFEDVFATVTGKYGKYGLWAGRAAVVIGVVGMLVSWLESKCIICVNLLTSTALHPLLQPMIELYAPNSSFLSSRVFWTLLTSTPLLPSLLPSRMTRSLRRSPFVIALLLPVVAFLVIGRTVEIKKASEIPSPIGEDNDVPEIASEILGHLTKRRFGLAGGSSAGAGLNDGWVNLARILMCCVALGSSNMWILRGRDTILKSMGVERGERQKAGKWVGLGLWVVVVALACLGGWVAEKIELLGVLATIAVGWFLPSLFFIVTFHVRSPLSIIFPSREALPDPDANPSPLPRRGHSRIDSLNDPSTDVLLARKERQLQKRRLGRRLWQDLIVYVGILPVGLITIAWTLGRLIGIW
ncbi:hypothetical protein CI109_107306 [Kwoniella shandongensis]|uniref:Amino acid transporter transmembrane domain-containing protein n=1 Tax=Kwoniella shandongensis TaxID=1734106 RepID=A0AAJ8N165_9TREE